MARMDVEIDPEPKRSLLPSNHCRNEIVDWPHSDLARTAGQIERPGAELITLRLSSTAEILR